MKLIKTTTSKESVPGKKSTRRNHGIFECPVCLEHVERPITHGNRNKSCGKKECRKAVFEPNINQEQNGGSKLIEVDGEEYTAFNKLEFYNSIKSFYNSLRKNNKVVIGESLDTLEKFINATYADYAVVRSEYMSRTILANTTDMSNTLEENNICFSTREKDLNRKLDKDLYVGQMEWCTHRLSKEIGIEHHIVNNSMSKSNIKSIGRGKINVTVNSTVMSEALSKDDYDTLKNILLFNSTKNKSDKLYLIESMGFTKIGITHNVEKRLGSLRGSSPMPVELLHVVEFGNRARMVEAYLHRKYSELQQNKEWFKLSESQVAELKAMLTPEYANTVESILQEERVNADNEERMLSAQKREESRKSYEAKLAEARAANVKPKIDTVVDQDMPELDDSNRIKAITKHGMKGTTEYTIWQSMKKKAKDKGFTVCDEWINDPKRFWDDVEALYDAVDVKPAMVIKDGCTEYNIDSISVVPLSQASNMNSRTKKVAKIDKSTGHEIDTYRSPIEACRANEGSNASKISACCRNERKSHAGYKWEYVS